MNFCCHGNIGSKLFKYVPLAFITETSWCYMFSNYFNASKIVAKMLITSLGIENGLKIF